MKVMQGTNGGLVKAWVEGLPPIENSAMDQINNMASLPFIHRHLAIMPDVHAGLGATIGTVIPTVNAIVPAAAGVDLGCGLIAQRTSLKASDLPDNLAKLRYEIEAAIPHGRTNNGGPGDKGAWKSAPKLQQEIYSMLLPRLGPVLDRHQRLEKMAKNAVNQLGTLGGGKQVASYSSV